MRTFVACALLLAVLTLAQGSGALPPAATESAPADALREGATPAVVPDPCPSCVPRLEREATALVRATTEAALGTEPCPSCLRVMRGYSLYQVLPEMEARFVVGMHEVLPDLQLPPEGDHTLFAPEVKPGNNAPGRLVTAYTRDALVPGTVRFVGVWDHRGPPEVQGWVEGSLRPIDALFVERYGVRGPREGEDRVFYEFRIDRAGDTFTFSLRDQRLDRDDVLAVLTGRSTSHPSGWTTFEAHHAPGECLPLPPIEAHVHFDARWPREPLAWAAEIGTSNASDPCGARTSLVTLEAPGPANWVRWRVDTV